MVEITGGLKFNGGDVKTFGGMHSKMYGVGIASVLGVYLIFIYYTVLLGWILRLIFMIGSSADDFVNQDGFF